jgi:hypothetical protein
MPTVVVEPNGSAVYATWSRGPSWRLTEDGHVTEQYRTPPDLPEWLVDIDDVCARIREVKLSKAVRVALAAQFGVEPEDLTP